MEFHCRLYRSLSAIVVAAFMFLAQGTIRAELVPANPSYLVSEKEVLLVLHFPAVVGGTGIYSLDFWVFNLPTQGESTAAMTLAAAQAFGDDDALMLEYDPIAGVAAGEGAVLQLVLSTTTVGQFEVAYELSFSSDGLPDAPIESLTVVAYADVILPGDYNRNWAVDPDDYEVWKMEYGATVNSHADGNANGIVDAADFTVWRDNLGAELEPPDGGGGFAVSSDNHMPGGTATPEPASACQFLIAMLWMGVTARSRACEAY